MSVVKMLLLILLNSECTLALCIYVSVIKSDHILINFNFD